MFTLERIKGKRFLVLGRAGMDIYAEPPGARTEEVEQFIACLGGSSANIAVALVKQGCSASLVTAVSDDAIGRFCLNQLDHYGVDRSHVKTVGGEVRTSLAVIESRVEDHQSVLYRNGAADFEMNEDDVTGLDYSAFSALIATGTIFAVEPSRSAGFKAFERAKEAGLPIVFDLDYRPYSWPSAGEAAEIYSRASAYGDIVIGNDEEFAVLAGNEQQGLARARALVQSTAQVVVYKRGEKGARTVSRDEEFQTGIYRIKALKPTGAGDGFMGGFIASLASGLSLNEAVMRGSATASYVVARRGCAPAMPTKAQLDDFLNQHPGMTEN